MKTYHLKVLNNGASMVPSKVVFQADSYANAVAKAHQTWKDEQCNVGLYSDTNGMTCWHYISYTGLAKDYNTNSGVLAQQQL